MPNSTSQQVRLLCPRCAMPHALHERGCGPVRIAEGLVEGRGEGCVADPRRGVCVDAGDALGQLAVPAVQLSSKKQGQCCSKRVPCNTALLLCYNHG